MFRALSFFPMLGVFNTLLKASGWSMVGEFSFPPFPMLGVFNTLLKASGRVEGFPNPVLPPVMQA